MKPILGILAVLLIAGGLWYYFDQNGTNSTNSTAEESPVTVTPILHATAILAWDGTSIYTDPTGGPEAFANQPAANIVLVTDIHGDHLSTTTLSSVVGGTASLVVPQAVANLLPASLASRATVLDNNEKITLQGFEITAMPMYNVPESAESRHTKGRGNGYVIERDGYRVYVAGDTAGIPEMRALRDIDLAFVPMNLPFTMSVEEAADAVLDFKPRIVYPYHYRGQEGLSDINRFKELVNAEDSSIQVLLANWYPEQ